MQRERPPRDSWIAIKPGQSLVFDRVGIEEAQTKASRIGREVRGAVLAAGFEVEWIIDQIILRAFHPGADAEEERALFDRLLLKKGPLRFANKIRLIKDLHKARASVRSALPEQILGLLDEVRTVRNDFAHYPVTLVPEGEEPISKLTPVLSGADADRMLDDASARQMLEKFASVVSGLDNALRVLSAEGTAGAQDA